MNIRKTFTTFLLTTFLVGCSNDIKEIPSMTLEEVAGSRLAHMSTDEREGLIYQFVSDTITVDSTSLLKIEPRDMRRIETLLNKVEDYLKGSNNDSIKEEYANYLLMEFARTPYEWTRSSVDAVGFDPASRLYFVDVKYSTANSFKRVIPSSKIAKGDPEEELLKRKRYTDYISYLTYAEKVGVENAGDRLAEFENIWGGVKQIRQEQQGIPLVERTQEEDQTSGGLGKLTYSGLIQDTNFNNGADMVIRYIFKYRYNLGEETDIEIESLYLKDYKMRGNESLVTGLTQENPAGSEVLKPFIDRLIISYHKAVEESNNTGLYKLFFDYSGVDKYYGELSKYTYNNTGGYNFKILSRNGKQVHVLVNRINKIRAKGAEMSLPTYEEKLIYTLVLDNDDKIKVGSVNLIDSTLVGEPISIIKNVSGVSEMIQYSGESFTESNKKAVEEAVTKFSKLVFKADVESEEFTEIVDIGVSQTVLKRMTDVITAIPNANRKVNYIVSWDTKTNVYVSLTLREIFEGNDSNIDTESIIDLVNRGGEWKVVNYTRKLSIKTAPSKTENKKALSIDER